MKYKKTKIICTIGPAVDTVEKICLLIDAGMDAARLNFSHGTQDIHKKYIKAIREAGKIKGKMIAVIQDISGPKIRVGNLENGEIFLAEGEMINITSEQIKGNFKMFSTNYPTLINDLSKNQIILLDDGRLKLRVVSVKPVKKIIECEIISGGILKEKKGINLPNMKLNLPLLTEKDLRDIDFGIRNNADFIAVSFVRSADDIKYVRSLLSSKNSKIP